MSDHSSHGSPNSVLLILVATFVFGFVTGGIIFLKINTGENASDTSNSTTDQRLSIEAHSYGVCEETGECLSYTINDGGGYTFVVGAKGGTGIEFEDTLTDKQYATLLEELSAADLLALSKTIFGGICRADHKGLSERYTIKYKGEVYQFDVCRQSLEGAPLFNTLYNYFVAFSVLHK